ncbi:cytochrome b/b6 domain-containing protein [Shewanella sp. OMA3-2]|uniref:cytochrome b/b6 domain-containing protein n=1 Tax=Shewanella sp. OMA3-2 TaxID=2908650 RepID=UPI001F17F519|nr:cytochrome b/b6 domain-containing protein [Shewanella sp. OMA3-2]UJF21632.1 cytochrome b/b6 domain-containing protein [Shewanella sp. OMA3-2]
MTLKLIWQKIAAKLHALVLVMSVILVCTSPWVLMGRQLSENAGFWSLFHVYGGLITACLALLFAIKICFKGQWRQFFPWLLLDFNPLKIDLVGIVKGRTPMSGGKGLLSIVEGIGIILLLLVAVTGVIWYFVDLGDALTWRSYHQIFAQCFIGFMIIHLLLGLLHIKDFFD